MTNWDITKALFLAPIKGAVFCMFLPFIGIAMLGDCHNASVEGQPTVAQQPVSIFREWDQMDLAHRLLLCPQTVDAGYSKGAIYAMRARARPERSVFVFGYIDWRLAIFAALPAGLVVWFYCRWRRQPASGLCPNSEYDLRATPE